MSEESTPKKPKKNNKTLNGLFVLAILLVLFLTMGFFPYIIGIFGFNITYSEGERVGQIIKVANKGIIWKTNEVGMGLTQSGAYLEYWNFSIDSENPNKESLIEEIKYARDTGDLIKIHYLQRWGARPWRGQTSYIVDKVEVIKTSSREHTPPTSKPNN